MPRIARHERVLQELFSRLIFGLAPSLHVFLPVHEDPATGLRIPIVNRLESGNGLDQIERVAVFFFFVQNFDIEFGLLAVRGGRSVLPRIAYAEWEVIL